MSSPNNSPHLRPRSSSLLQPPTFPKHDTRSDRSSGTSPASFRFSNIGEVSTAPTTCSISETGSRKSACSDEEIQAAPTLSIASASASAEDRVGQWLSADDAPVAQSVFPRAMQQLPTSPQGLDQTPTVVLDANTELERAGLAAHDANTPAASLIGVGQVVLQPRAEPVEQTVPFTETEVPQRAPSESYAPASAAIANGGLQLLVAALFLLLAALTFAGTAACFSVNIYVFNAHYVFYRLHELMKFVGPPVLEAIGAACTIVIAFRIYEFFLIFALVLAITSVWASLWILQWIANAAGYDLKLVLPLMIAGREVEVFVDGGGLNLMSIQAAADFGLEPSGPEMDLMTAYGDLFPSPGEVTAPVGFLGEQHTELLTFRVVDIPFLPITVNKAFRDKHDLKDPLHPQYRHRPYTAGELLSCLLAVVSVVDTHLHNVRDFLQVDLPLACEDVEPVMALLDSGSAVDAFSLAFITKHFPKGRMRKCSKYVKCANGDRKHADQKMEVPFFVNGQAIMREFYVFAHLKVDMILGGPFDIAHRPHRHMSDQIVSKELQIAGPYPAAAYHFGMQHAGKGTSLLLRGWRHLKKQPAPPASAAIQSELDRVRKAECELQTVNSARISDIDDNNARSEARVTERARHLAVFRNIELLNGQLHEALALENGILPLPAAPATPIAGPVIDPATGPATLAAVLLPVTTTQPSVHIDPAPPSASVTAARPEVSQVGTVRVSDGTNASTDASERLHEATGISTTKEPPATEQPTPSPAAAQASVPAASEVAADTVPVSDAAQQAESAAGSQSERSNPVNSLVPASFEVAGASSAADTPAPSNRSGSDISPPVEQPTDSNYGNVMTLAANGTLPTSEALPVASAAAPGDLDHAVNHNGVAFGHHKATHDHDELTNGSLKRVPTQ